MAGRLLGLVGLESTFAVEARLEGMGVVGKGGGLDEGLG